MLQNKEHTLDLIMSMRLNIFWFLILLSLILTPVFSYIRVHRFSEMRNANVCEAIAPTKVKVVMVRKDLYEEMLH